MIVLHPCRRVVTLDAWETVPPGNESALMQVSWTTSMVRTLCQPDDSLSFSKHVSSLCCSMP